MQNYKVLLVILCAILSGCASSYQDTQQASPSHTPSNVLISADKKNKEELAWAQVEKLSMSRCGPGTLPPARKDAVALSFCVTRLVVHYVLPYSPLPDAVLASREEAHKLAHDYARGEITSKEYTLGSMARLQKYRKAWIRLADKETLKAAEKYWIGDRPS